MPTIKAPMMRATRSPAGARRSALMAAVATAIARRSIMPKTSRTVIAPAQQALQRRPRRNPVSQAPRASAGRRPGPGARRQQAS